MDQHIGLDVSLKDTSVSVRQDGILNKVRRGEYRCPLPTGFIYDEVGDVALDPDAQIREMIAHFFETFTRVGSATQTIKAFAREGLLFPSRVRNSKQVIFQPLTASTAMRTLHNPRYAGVYAYGQRLYRRTVDGKKQLRKRDPNEWLACIPDAHPGYISWEQYQHNLKILEANGGSYETVRASPPREGAALMQGRVICGRCGSHMKARYADRRGQVDTWYVCSRAYETRGERHCQSIAGWPIDDAIGELIAAEMTPTAVELAVEIRKEIESRHDEADQLRLRAVERARIDADLAQRRFMLVDPNNRLVADTLEREWNDKLRLLADLQEERERALRDGRLTLDDAIRDRLIAMTTDFKTVWHDPTLPNRERKRLLAYLVEDVTLVKVPAEGETRIHIRFRGGRTETLTTQNPKSSAQQVKTRPEVVELVDKLLDEHICAEIKDILNAKGIRPGGSARRDRADAQFTDLRVIYLVKQYGLRTRYDRLRARGMLTKAEACAKLGISDGTLVRWAKYGIVERHAYDGYRGLYEPPGPHVPAKQSSRWNQLVHRADTVRRLSDPKCIDLDGRAAV